MFNYIQATKRNAKGFKGHMKLHNYSGQREPIENVHIPTEHLIGSRQRLLQTVTWKVAQCLLDSIG